MLLMSYGADLNARTISGELPIDMGHRNTEELKQAIRDEPRRRMDEAPGKRATEQDRHPNATTSSSTQQVVVGEVEQSNKRPRFEENGAVAAAAAEKKEEIKVAEEDVDSEPSDNDVDD